MKNEAAQLPKNLAQWMPFILSGVFVVIVFIASLAVVQHQVDEQFISKDVLKQSLKQLESYSEESSLLAKATLNKTTPKSYVSTYASNLQEATDSLSEKLSEHPHAYAIDYQTLATIRAANNLSDQLEGIATQPLNQLASDLSARAENLSQQIQQLEQQL